MIQFRAGIMAFLKHGLLLIAVAIIFFPPFILVNNALKTKLEFAQTSVFTLPGNLFNFENFRIVLERAHLDLAYKNTFLIALVAIVGNVVLGTMVAYTLGRFQFRLRKVVMALYIIVSFIPMITTQIATFTVIQHLQLYNTLFAPMVLYMGTDVLQIFLYLQFINHIPKELDENAMVEGASLFKIYRSIVFPLLAPATATVVIIKTIGIYNDMFIPFLYMPSSKLAVVSTSLMKFSAERSTEWELMSAAILMIMVPIVVLYLFFQRYVFAGIVSGAVK